MGADNLDLQPLFFEGLGRPTGIFFGFKSPQAPVRIGGQSDPGAWVGRINSSFAGDQAPGTVHDDRIYKIALPEAKNRLPGFARSRVAAPRDAIPGAQKTGSFFCFRLPTISTASRASSTEKIWIA